MRLDNQSITTAPTAHYAKQSSLELHLNSNISNIFMEKDGLNR